MLSLVFIIGLIFFVPGVYYNDASVEIIYEGYYPVVSFPVPKRVESGDETAAGRARFHLIGGGCALAYN